MSSTPILYQLTASIDQNRSETSMSSPKDVGEQHAEEIAIDGVLFRAFRNEQALNECTQREESASAKKSFGGSRPTAARRTTKTSTVTSSSAAQMATETQPTVINANVKALRDPLLSCSGLAQIPPPPPLYKMMCKSGGGPTKGGNGSQSAAFKSDLLDEYLARSKQEISGQNLEEELGSPPEDSPIYSTGTLKMNPTPDVVRKPFADLPLLSRGTTAPSSSTCPKRPRPRWPSPDPGTLNAATAPPAKVPKLPPGKKVKLPALPEPLNQTVDTEDTAAENYYAADALEVQCDVLKRSAREYSVQNAKNYNVSLTVDESYVRMALDALKVPTDDEDESDSAAKLAGKADEELDSADVGDENSSGKGKKRRGNVSDIATMISRHSKRDIRLPARFHQSGMMVGNQWIVPDIGEEEPKRGRRRYLDEQRRLQKTQKVRASDTPNRIDPPPKAAYQPPKSVAKLRSMSLLASKQSPASSSSSPSPSSLLAPLAASVKSETFIVSKSSRRKQQFQVYKSSLDHQMEEQLHNERLEKIRSLQQQPHNLSISSEPGTSATPPVEHRKGINRLIKTMPRPSGHPNFVVDANGRMTQMTGHRPPISNIMNRSNSLAAPVSAINAKKMMMRDLYRELYIANDPERHKIWRQRGVRPRVNKPLVLRESIQIISRLKSVQQQQIHYKRVLELWQEKLRKCLKIMQSKGTYDEEKKKEAVDKFMEKYRNSFLYQVTEEVEKRTRELTEKKAKEEQEELAKPKLEQAKANRQLEQIATEPKHVVQQQQRPSSVPNIIIPQYHARSNIDSSHARSDRPLAVKQEPKAGNDQQLRPIIGQSTPNINLSFNNHMSVKRVQNLQEKPSKIFVIQVPAGTNISQILASTQFANQ